MSWNMSIPGLRPVAPHRAAARPRAIAEHFAPAGGCNAEAPPDAAETTQVAGVALLLLQSDAASRSMNRSAEADRAISDLSDLQIALLRGAELPAARLEVLAARAEALADADAGSAGPAGAIALRLKVEIARRGMVAGREG